MLHVAWVQLLDLAIVRPVPSTKYQGKGGAGSSSSSSSSIAAAA